MICFRCGTDVANGAPECPNCGQRFMGGRKTFTATTTSFKALEKRKLRARKTAAELEFPIGEVIEHRYEIKDLIGTGPLGVVYRVHDQEIEEDVALKVIHRRHVEDLDEDAIEGLCKAVRKARKLSQQNIVRLYDEIIVDGQHMFTMQLLEGLTLRKVMGLRREKGQRFSLFEAEPILGQICMALGHAHRHTAHGDLKPENVLILPDVLKLTDFAMYEALPRATFAKAQADAGCAAYLAPEILEDRSVDSRADIYSLGAMLYELLTGQVYGPDAAPITEISADLGGDAEALSALIAQACDPEPTKRFSDVEAFAEALGTLVDAVELSSVDIEAVEDLLPEEVTRKVRMRQAAAESAAEIKRTHLGMAQAAELVAASVAANKAGSPAPMAEAEESFIEEIGGDELDALIDEQAPLGTPVVPQSEVPPSMLSPVDLAPPPELELEPEEQEAHGAALIHGAAAPTDVTPAPGAGRRDKPLPWILGSTMGFGLVVLLVVAVLGGGTWWLIQTLTDGDEPQPQVVNIGSEGKGAAMGANAGQPPKVAPAVADAATPDAASPDAATPDATAPDAGAPDAEIVVAREPERPAPVAAVKQAPREKPAAEKPSVDKPVTVAAVKRPSVDRAAERAAAEKAAADKAAAEKAAAERVAAEKAARAAAEKTAVERAAAEKVAAEKAAAEKLAAEKAAAEKAAAEKAAAEKAAAEKAAAEKAAQKEDAPPSDGQLRCPSGMRLVTRSGFPKGGVKGGVIQGSAAVKAAKGGAAYCVDAYEYPGRGRKPKTRVSFAAAKGMCAAKGKRLCSGDEWKWACGAGRTYPYGNSFNPSRCGTEDEDEEERAISAGGRFSRCKSRFGVYDMSGNVAEWTSDQRVRGGDAADAEEDVSCGASEGRAPGSTSGSVGFRCCQGFDD